MLVPGGAGKPGSFRECSTKRRHRSGGGGGGGSGGGGGGGGRGARRRRWGYSLSTEEAFAHAYMHACIYAAAGGEGTGTRRKTGSRTDLRLIIDVGRVVGRVLESSRPHHIYNKTRARVPSWLSHMRMAASILLASYVRQVKVKRWRMTIDMSSDSRCERVQHIKSRSFVRDKRMIARSASVGRSLAHRSFGSK